MPLPSRRSDRSCADIEILLKSYALALEMEVAPIGRPERGNSRKDGGETQDNDNRDRPPNT